MRVDLIITPHQTDEMALRERTVVVIDVLRASTSIITALKNGAREIIPVTTVESAMKISGNLFGDVILLGGERNGRMIEGFHLGNSPANYSEEKVKGKAIIFSSTNGSQALVKSRYAKDLMVCGFVNISAVANHLDALGGDCTILCAGSNGMLSLEDCVCGGMLIHRLLEKEKAAPDRPGDRSIVLTDGALAAHALYKSFGKSIVKMIRGSDHGRYLEEIGFGDDLKTCAEVDTIPVVPQLDGNVIRLKREPERKDTAQGQGAA